MLSYGKNITAFNDTLNKVKVEYLFHSLCNPKQEIKSQINQLRIIRDIDSKQYSLLKRRLPYIVCAHFNPLYRRTENFAYTEYFIIDIDHLSSKEISLDTLREKLKNDERIVLLFTSPGEDGMKVMFKLTERCYDSGLYSLFYKSFLRDFSKQYSLEQVVDERTSDVCRACFISVDADAYYNPQAQPVDFNAYIDTENPQELLSLNKELVKEIKENKSEKAKSEREIDDETISKIKSLLNPKSVKAKKPAPYIPEQLNEIIDELKVYVENTGVVLYEIVNIQYGKKLRFKLGHRLGEVNLFYGKHGFSVVKSPKSGTSAEVNDLMAALVEEFLITTVQ